jgi:hypothetical protein
MALVVAESARGVVLGAAPGGSRRCRRAAASPGPAQGSGRASEEPHGAPHLQAQHERGRRASPGIEIAPDLTDL